MAKVLYKQGSKATYLGLLEKNPNALYFCTDTKELYKGRDLYSDGIRFVENYSMLPEFAHAADGVIYFCEDTRCGYVLSATRDDWIVVFNGVDNTTIAINNDGLMYVKSVPVESVIGLADLLASVTKQVIKGSDEIAVSEDGVLSLIAIPQSKVIGLEDRLSNIENAVAGGIRYCGAVDTYSDLPVDASQGDMYEVREDNTEWCWNGEQWFELGKTNDISNVYATKEEVRSIAKMVNYEVAYKPEGALVNYTDHEIRIMCSENTGWKVQNGGSGSDPNKYYVGFKAYAPNNEVVSFKEDLAEIISDSTMYYFENNDFAGVDEYGRKYSIVWLPVATLDESTGEWTYYGAKSTEQKYIGWYYSVDWYDANGVKVAADTIRINLTNEQCHTSIAPYYVGEVQSAIDALEDTYTWGDM